jgi:Tol biopolymer transport system component
LSDRPGQYRQSIEGTSGEEVFTAAVGGLVTDWSRDGRYLVENRQASSDRRDRDIWVTPLDGREAHPYVNSPFNEFMGKISPDGKLVAYVSDETSRSEVYIDSFPQRSRKRRVSIRGGDRPVWSRSGKELFFIGADQSIMTAEVVDRGDRLDVGAPQTLFAVRVAMGLASDRSWFDVSDDGRFLIPTLVDRSTSLPLTVIVNWPTLLSR